MLYQYDGEFGCFEYDDTEFVLDTQHTYYSKDFLRYIGEETNGNNIKIPKGIINCACMFAFNQNLLSMPEIPNTVKVCDSMFQHCINLVEVRDLPDSVISAEYMFMCCNSIKAAPKLSKNLENAEKMFLECNNLLLTPNTIPYSLKNGDCMFGNCDLLVYYPPKPKKRTPNFDYMYPYSKTRYRDLPTLEYICVLRTEYVNHRPIKYNNTIEKYFSTVLDELTKEYFSFGLVIDVEHMENYCELFSDKELEYHAKHLQYYFIYCGENYIGIMIYMYADYD